MADDRRRGRRVRHEAGGSTAVEAPPSSAETVPPSVASTTAATAAPTSASVASRAPNVSRGGRSARGGGRGSRGGVHRVGSSATNVSVDETQYYQAVTIMKSKDSGKTAGMEEIDEAEPQKYRRRGIVSNWSRYDERPESLDDVEDGSDYLIGEDYNQILESYSLGGSGGGHLQLKGEGDWGFDDDASMDVFKSKHGLGALRVSDLANTIATIPLMQQLGMTDDYMPEQLVEYYNALADDNRRLYDPNEDVNNPDNTAEIIEQQMKSLRLAFFDGGSQTRTEDNKNLKNRSFADKKSGATKGKENINKVVKIVNGNMDNREETEVEEMGVFASSVDFDELNKAMEDDTVEEKADDNVDLTEKMCKVFGSNINDVGDDFGGFVVECEEEEIQKPIPVPVEKSKPKRGSKQTKTSLQTNVRNDFNDDKLGTAEPKADTELDFSAGSESFNFGLPKLSAQENAAPALLKNIRTKTKVEDLDVFTPVADVAKETSKENVADDQPMVDLNAPIVPQSVTLVTTKKETQELEDWLDSVLDD